VVWAADDGYKGVYKKEWLGKGQVHEFEGLLFNIPDDFDSILKKLYGDYMTPPPTSECIGHHFYKAYRRVLK
ncbi:MAG: LicD family protein, partial [Lachnospiraceae bacterium]|nr:LicD family protein [Lachnospiraceae bacterium]